MIELKGSRFTQILPENLSSQTRTRALAYAVGRQVDKLLAMADRMVIWADLDRVPEELLDCLAVELRTPAYSQDYPVETKRTLVRESLLFYARMGTPAAVARATSTTPVRTGDAVSLTVEYRSDLDGGLEEGFSINEYGLFAKTADSAETLIFYGCLGDHPQWVYPYTPRRRPRHPGLSGHHPDQQRGQRPDRLPRRRLHHRRGSRRPAAQHGGGGHRRLCGDGPEHPAGGPPGPYPLRRDWV